MHNWLNERLQAVLGVFLKLIRAAFSFPFGNPTSKPLYLQTLYLASLIVAGVLVALSALSIVFPLRVHIEYSHIVTARDGTVIHAFLSRDDKWRMRTELYEISPTLRTVLLQKEDRWFYWHCGVNPVALVRALANNLRKQRITSGASTITMQVARMIEDRPRTLWSKLVETFRALQLEARFSKDEILQLYLNLAPYGGNIEGVKAASLLYFGQQPERLSLAQAVALAIIPNRPTSLSLKNIDANIDTTHTRNSQFLILNSQLLSVERNKWLQRLLAEHVFSAAEIQDALNEPLDIQRREPPAIAPHFANRMKATFPDDVVVHTTLDVAKQANVQMIAANKIRRLKMYGINNAAVLVVDNQTREVLVYLGSPDFGDKVSAGEVDGVRAVRSPGSALKPLIYGLAMDKGLITPKTMLNDVPINLGGYAPENFDRRYNGSVTAEKALINSFNVPAVKLLDRVGITPMVEKLKQAGFEQVRKDERKLGLSLILGGCGVRLEEMVGLYCAFANGGRFGSLRFIDESRMRNGGGDNSQFSIPNSQLLSQGSTFMLAEILTQLNRPDVPNRLLGNTKLPKIAWKTGTSYGRRDAWSIGFNKRFTIGVWVGNFSGAGVPELVGADMATPLLFELFNAIDYNSSNDWFVPPATLDFRLVCSESGLQPSEFCENQITDYYIPSVSSNKKCEHLKYASVAMDERMSYCPDCLPSVGQYKIKLYPNLVPELLALYNAENYAYARIPPHNRDCKRVQSGQSAAPAITSLVDGKEYLVEHDTKGAVISELMLTCQAGNEVRTVYWFVNDRLVKAAEPRERIFFKPQKGECKISCSDDNGRTSNIWITVGWQ